MNFKKMKKRFFSLSRGNGGFTLVELIVVIAILAILGGVAVPAYSGYVEKAKLAGDEQLLAAVNTAFAAACAENGTDTYNVVGNPYFDVETVKLTQPETYVPAFDRYFAGNEETTFEVFDFLKFNTELGLFEGNSLTDAYLALMDTLKNQHGTDIATLLASSFGNVGIAELADKVDVASVWVASMIQNPNFQKLLYDEANMTNIVKALGFNAPTDEGFSEAWMDLISQKQAQLDADPANEGKDTYTMAMNQLLANSAVLTAATNSSKISTDFMTNLSNGTAKDTILHNVNDADGDPAAAVSQAAMAYGMYAAYLTHSGKEIPNTVNLSDVYSVLDDPSFQTYVKEEGGQAQTDLNGYLAAMNMITTSSKNNDAAKDVLLNGFANDQLVGVLQGVTSTK